MFLPCLGKEGRSTSLAAPRGQRGCGVERERSGMGHAATIMGACERMPGRGLSASNRCLLRHAVVVDERQNDIARGDSLSCALSSVPALFCRASLRCQAFPRTHPRIIENSILTIPAGFSAVFTSPNAVANGSTACAHCGTYHRHLPPQQPATLFFQVFTLGKLSPRPSLPLGRLVWNDSLFHRTLDLGQTLRW